MNKRKYKNKESTIKEVDFKELKKLIDKKDPDGLFDDEEIYLLDLLYGIDKKIKENKKDIIKLKELLNKSPYSRNGIILRDSIKETINEITDANESKNTSIISRIKQWFNSKF
jgi:hypothetical protein